MSESTRPTLQEDALQRVLQAAEQSGVETIRLSFADQHGVLRGKTILLDGLEEACRSGVAMTSTLLLKDLSHRTVFPVWSDQGGLNLPGLKGAGDVLMVPDISTFRVLPWANKTGWMLCDLFLKDGQPFPFCSRAILRQAETRLEALGYAYNVGLELEFTVVALEDAALTYSEGGHPHHPPATRPVTHGYQYLTESRADILEPIFDRIRSLCAALDLPLRSLEVEFGPSQIEATFHPQGGVATADAMVLFRSAVKQALHRDGYHATFMCRPGLPDAFANGWHIHQSLTVLETGNSAFAAPDAPLSEIGMHFLAGLLNHATDVSLLTTPTINGYKRYRPFVLAPDRILWGEDNKGAMLRVVGSGSAARIENRAPEPGANPYLCLAAQLYSGLAGISNKSVPPPPTENPYAEGAFLPRTILEALEAFADSTLVGTDFPEGFQDYLLTLKRAEVARFFSEVTDWEQREYFSVL